MPPESKKPLERICESNSAECSGTVPCGACYYLVFTTVIPGAMRAGGFARDKAQAAAFLKAYVAGWQKLLEDKVAERKANQPSSFEVPPQLLEFFAYRNAAKLKESVASVQTETTSTVVVEPAATTTKSKKKGTGSKLLRGDLKRMVEKQGKEPLANGSSSGIRQNSTEKVPGNRDEEKH